jgi:hypothetical protein
MINYKDLFIFRVEAPSLLNNPLLKTAFKLLNFVHFFIGLCESCLVTQLQRVYLEFGRDSSDTVHGPSITTDCTHGFSQSSQQTTKQFATTSLSIPPDTLLTHNSTLCS